MGSFSPLYRVDREGWLRDHRGWRQPEQEAPFKDPEDAAFWLTIQGLPGDVFPQIAEA